MGGVKGVGDHNEPLGIVPFRGVDVIFGIPVEKAGGERKEDNLMMFNQSETIPTSVVIPFFGRS